MKKDELVRVVLREVTADEAKRLRPRKHLAVDSGIFEAANADEPVVMEFANRSAVRLTILRQGSGLLPAVPKDPSEHVSDLIDAARKSGEWSQNARRLEWS